jgi:dipeptidyl aminopeptidase/acylaminoacyl peptidase
MEQPARHQALINSALPKLLPVREFVANTDYNGGYTVSPDGKKLAWIAVRGFGTAIFVKTIGQDNARSLSLISHNFRWAGDSRRLLLLKDRKGDENSHVWVLDTERPEEPAVDLTPFDNTHAEIQAVIPDSSSIIVVHNHRDARSFDLYRTDIVSHTSTLVAENPGDVASWVVDNKGVLCGRIRYSGDHNWLEIKQGDAWRTIYSWKAKDTVEVLSVTADHQRMWLRSNHERDRVALLSISTTDGRETVFHEDPNVDVSEVGISRVTDKPMFAQFYPDYPHIEIFESDLRNALQAFRNKLMDELKQFLGMEILSVDQREENFVLSAYDHSGKSYYLWNRKSGTDTLLGSDAMRRHAADLAPIRPIAFKSRDGLTLHGYLTLPQGVAPRHLPMVLLVHGGPFARNLWADPDFWPDATRVQFLANRGYAVLQINYRGSTGYGRKFYEAAIGEFAGTMQLDLLDATDWAIREGVADPDHIAIMGASYGGYATLFALTQSPKTFACGVDIFGPSDLVSLLEKFPPYWQSILPVWRRFVGDPTSAEVRRQLTDKSPLKNAAKVERPLLIIQGTGDVRSAADQSDNMVAALRAAGKPVEYMRISGMGHGSTYWPHNLRIYRKTEDFLSECLGGRSSGFDYYELVAWAL